jgi:5-methylcytosine-specific restriction protein A
MGKRNLEGSGWVNQQKRPRGPNGRGICRWCGQEVPKGRRTFCNDKCVHQHKIRSQASYQASCVFDRDAAVCALCGVNADVVRSEYRAARSGILRKDHPSRYEELKELADRYKKEGWNVGLSRRWWDVDHIVPVVEGGGPNDWPKDQDYLDNLRTLCVPCHKKETAKLRKRLKKNK